jgi:chromate transporter
LAEVGGLFLKLGTISVGGPAAHIALMEEETVERRRWLTREQFLDMVAAVNLVPGPNAAEMAIWLGHMRAGWAGFLVGGAAFILPAAFLSALLAWAYQRYGALPELHRVFALGIHPAVLGVILAAAMRLGRAALTHWSWGLWTAGALALSLIGADPVRILLGAGAAALLRRWFPQGAGGLLAVGVLPGMAGGPDVGAVALFFLKVGALLFGTGMMLYAFIERELVALGWLTPAQLIDAVAVGQMTPGPVLSSATFIGWLLAGPGGAAVATAAIFLPSFVIVAVLSPSLPRIRRWPGAREFLAGVSAAVVGVIAAVAVRLAWGMHWDVGTGILFPVGLGLLLFGRWPAWAVVLAGAMVGAVRYLAGG